MQSVDWSRQYNMFCLYVFVFLKFYFQGLSDSMPVSNNKYHITLLITEKQPYTVSQKLHFFGRKLGRTQCC